MLAALAVSALFLLLYLFHKLALYQATGEPNKRFPTDPSVAPDAARYTYYGILLTHLVLAISVPFLALRAGDRCHGVRDAVPVVRVIERPQPVSRPPLSGAQIRQPSDLRKTVKHADE